MDRFIQESTLGSGAFGSVRLMREKTTGRQHAVKVLRRRDASKYMEGMQGDKWIRVAVLPLGREQALNDLRLCRCHFPSAAEIVNHSLLRHPHIVHFREVFLTEEHLCIVMEYANGGSLFNLVRKERRLKESLARWFFQQLILAVDYCHKRGVANRDIKLENLLLHNESNLPNPLLKVGPHGCRVWTRV